MRARLFIEYADRRDILRTITYDDLDDTVSNDVVRQLVKELLMDDGVSLSRVRKVYLVSYEVSEVDV